MNNLRQKLGIIKSSPTPMKWSCKRLTLTILLAFVAGVSTEAPAQNVLAFLAPGPTVAAASSDIVQMNPDFVDPNGDKDGPNDSESDVSDNDEKLERKAKDDKETTATKTALAQALEASRKKSKQPIQLIKKHYLKAFVLVGIYLFRESIFSMVFNYFVRTTRNPGSSETIYVFRTSSFLTLLFTLAALHRALKSYREGGDFMSVLIKSHPIIQMFAPFLPKLLSSVNPSFVPESKQHYAFERINERYIKDGMALQKSLSLKHERFLWPIPVKDINYNMPIQSKNITLTKASKNDVVVIMDLTQMDTTVSTINDIRDQVSFLLSQHREAAMKVSTMSSNGKEVMEAIPKLEVVVVIESPGGGVEEYGYAAQQLLRLRKDPDIELTVCVDKIAASGGYMLACTASPGRLLAAPFSTLGSIGVIGQIINVHKALLGWGVNPIVLRGGKDKAPLGLVDNVTREGKERLQNRIDNIHRAFIQHVVDARPILKDNIAKVSTGETWLGYDAVENGLADEITTSDEYIAKRVKQGARVVKMVKCVRVRGFWGKESMIVALSNPVGEIYGRTMQRVRAAVSQTVDYLLQVT